MTVEPLLAVDDLAVEFATPEGTIAAVDGVSFTVQPHEIVGIVGESGSGKSVTALSMLRMLPHGGVLTRGQIRFGGRDVHRMSDEELRRLRGSGISMIFQDPSASLNPVVRVGAQVAEALRAHQEVSWQQANTNAVGLLHQVGIPDPEERMREYPFQLSGGMRQRVMIAMALINEPALLLADEPTTALDVTIQAQILELLESINSKRGTAMMLITHNIGVVGRLCSRALVMYAGKIVEDGPVEQLFRAPTHPYTHGLLQAIPRLEAKRTSRLASIEGQPPDPLHRPPGCPFVARCLFAIERCQSEMPPLVELRPGQHSACWVTQSGLELTGVDLAPPPKAASPRDAAERRGEDDRTTPLLELADVAKHFAVRGGLFGRRRDAAVIRAVDDVSLTVERGETLGLVGESGCGKSTLGRTILHLYQPTSGSIALEGRETAQLSERDFRPLRRRVQMIFQDPYSSLNPRMTVEQVIAEPLKVHHLLEERLVPGRVDELLERVGLSSRARRRYPHEFSGGQRQRIAIARALAVDPELIVCDEPVSALDVSLQAQVVNLLRDLQRELGIAYVFIAHDLAVVSHMSDRIAVMYLGQVVELAPTDRLVNNPLHPYTNALLSAVLLPESRWEHRRERIVLRGDLPSPRNPPSACRFHTRCPIGPRYYPERTICEEVEPPLAEHAPGQFAACHFAGELTDSATRPRSRHPQSSARALTSVADPTSPVDEKRRRSE